VICTLLRNDILPVDLATTLMTVRSHFVRSSLSTQAKALFPNQQRHHPATEFELSNRSPNMARGRKRPVAKSQHFPRLHKEFTSPVGYCLNRITTIKGDTASDLRSSWPKICECLIYEGFTDAELKRAAAMAMYCRQNYKKSMKLDGGPEQWVWRS
jgi:hypothetical protein